MDSDGVGTYTVEPFHGFAEYRTVGGKREAHWTGKVELIEDKLLEPLSWRRKAAKFRAKHGRKPRCFTNSMSDLFHERLLERSIARVFASMAFAPEIDFLCLTKRADRAESILGTGRFHDQIIDEMNAMRYVSERIAGIRWPLPNVWLGVSCEDQKRADERIPHLLRTPAAVRFLSCEPLLEGLDLMYPAGSNPPVKCCSGLDCACMGKPVDPPLLYGVDWVITGSESGPGARPCQEDWIRSLRDQCVAARTPFFYKQAIVNGKKVETPELDGQRWIQFPEVPA